MTYAKPEDCRTPTTSINTSTNSSSAPVPPVIATEIPPNTPSKESQEFLELEGTTIFAAPPAPTYRYLISLKRGKLRIWLEDCNSKRQWCTPELSLQDFTDPTSAIPDLTASDYAECFRELLNSAHDNVNKIPCTFQRKDGEVFRLELSVTIQVLLRSRVTTYAFDLEPITVKRIDVLESKMKDLQDEVEALRGDGQEAAVNRKSEMRELQEIVNKLQQDLNGRAALVAQLQRDLKAQQPASDDGEVIQMQATMKSGEIICWKNIGLNVVMVVNGMDGTICPLNSGIYQVMVVVDHHATTQNLSIKLMKDAECIQAAYCGSSQGQHGSTSLVCTVRMTTADQLTVKCSANLTSTSYLTLVRLGK